MISTIYLQFSAVEKVTKMIKEMFVAALMAVALNYNNNKNHLAKLDALVAQASL
jgi:hypothetical protein